MSLLTYHLDEGMVLLADVIEKPAFRNEEVERRRKQRLVRIAQETDAVQRMASRVGPRALYGDQPYGMSPTGTTESMNSITQADVAGFYSRHYGPNDSALVLSGDLTRSQAEALARKYFGSWSNKAAEGAEIPAPPAAQPTRVVIVDKPGAPQTALFAYGFGVPANSPDVDVLEMLSYTLGTAFGSRINMNLREVHGYTYGAFSGFRQYRGGGVFFAGSLVRTDVTAPAAKEMMSEIRNFPQNPSTAQELAEAKEASIRSLPGQFDTNSSVASAFGSLFVYSRPLDYYAKLPAKYEAITQADIAGAAKQYLHPDQLVIVTAGDRSKIEPGLKDAGLGPIELRDVNGNRVTGDTQK
jgi:zinc protease